MPDAALLAALQSWTVDDSRNRGLKRWSRSPAGVLDLTVAEMDFPIAEPIMVAVRDAVERQAFGYPLTEEYTRFQAVTAHWLRQRGLSIPTDHVFMVSDVLKGQELALDRFTRRDAPVVVVTPTYSAFFETLWITRRTAIEVPLAETAEGYRLDIDAIEDAFRAGASTLLLCNPSNPTGTVHSRDELIRLADLAGAYDVRVISDEVHAPLSYPGVEYVSYASVSPAAAATAITVTSASKTWNIPGLRCAVIAFTNVHDLKIWHALPIGAKGGISPLGISATIAAFEGGQPWLDAALALLEGKRDLVVSGLNGLGYGELIHAPAATYLGWADLRGLGLESPHTWLREEAGVAVTPGADHGAAGSGFVRINLATPDAQLHDFLDRMERVLESAPAVRR
ncbi:MalY/PatB family protein [Streptomyces sp. NPDC002520]